MTPEAYDSNQYREKLKKSIIKALIYFNEKIQSISERKLGEIPGYFQLGVDFEPKISVSEYAVFHFSFRLVTRKPKPNCLLEVFLLIGYEVKGTFAISEKVLGSV